MTLEEGKTYSLRENVTGTESGRCSFRFRFGGRDTRYFELEVSPFGVRFWGEVTIAEGERRLKKLLPPFEAEVTRTQEGYAVQIKLPLSAMQGYDRNTVMLNACLDKKQDGRQDLYALNPTRCATFHKGEYFLKIGKKEEVGDQT